MCDGVRDFYRVRLHTVVGAGEEVCGKQPPWCLLEGLKLHWSAGLTAEKKMWM